MRKFAILSVLLMTVTAQLKASPLLDSLLAKRDYFQLRKTLSSPRQTALPEHRKLYYQAFVQNFFHELSASNHTIGLLFKKYRNQFNETELGKLLGKKIDNHVKRYEYKQAFLASELLLTKFGHTLSKEDRDDIANSAIIWKGLQRVPSQKTSISQDTRLAYKRDMAGLINVPVQFNDSTFDFVFDTGANLSVITESYAIKAGLDVRDIVFKVRAITGIEVNARLGIAASLRMGSVEVNNVVFIVFPDSVLSFGGGVYKIKGIIGFPVIEQLQEVRIDKSGKLVIPQQATEKSLHNFGIDELTPVVNIAVNKDTLAFTFDTGAQGTGLNLPFYERYKTTIEATGKPFDQEMGGAGGSRTTKAWRLPVTIFHAGGHSVSIPGLGVKTTSTESKDKFYYGNLGQDLMSQFRELVINFKYMYVDFVR